MGLGIDATAGVAPMLCVCHQRNQIYRQGENLPYNGILVLSIITIGDINMIHNCHRDSLT